MISLNIVAPPFFFLASGIPERIVFLPPLLFEMPRDVDNPPHLIAYIGWIALDVKPGHVPYDLAGPEEHMRIYICHSAQDAGSSFSSLLRICTCSSDVSKG